MGEELGVALIALALGWGVQSTWKYGRTRLARCAPLVLALIYYITVFAFPPPSQVILGTAFLVIIAEFAARLKRNVRRNASLEAENNRLKGRS